jgi:hypothetical protein
MDKRTAIITALVCAATVVLVCAVLWRDLSKKYVIRWNMPFHAARSKSPTEARGNVCVVDSAYPPSIPSACADVYLFPNIYGAIGVDEGQIIKWQNENGFDSGGVDPVGTLLAPDYPIFSRLAWTLMDPVYLKGDELSALLEESKRISERSHDPAVRASLHRISALAAKAQQESKVLRFFG